MTDLTAIPPPVPKLDAKNLLQQLNLHAGTRLEFDGAASGGEVGGAFVRWPDGRPGVMTRGARNLVAQQRTDQLLEIARARGIPAPKYHLIHPLPDGTIVIVQERLTGHPPRRVNDDLIDGMICLNDLCADLLQDRPKIPSMDMYLTRSGPGFCLHESLDRYDDRTRRLLHWVQEVGRTSGETLPGNDLVHPDYHPGNVLVDDTGEITGVIDWGEASRGDRQFALITLAFDLGWRMRNASEDTATARQRLADRIKSMHPEHRRIGWAHMSLRMVDWAIRHYSPEVIDHYLDFAATHVDF